MSKKDKDKVEEKKDEQLDNEPWEQPIYEEGEGEAENSDPSRTNRRSKTDGKNWYAISLITLLFLIVIVATFLILYFKANANMNTKKDIVESSSLIVEKSDVTSKTSSSTKESTTVESSTVASSTPETSTVPSSSTFADVEVSPNDVNTNQQNADNANVAAQENQTPATPAGGASVNVGENGNVNLYRIAKNNGLTVDEVMQLNPGIDSQNLQPGQSIRIK